MTAERREYKGAAVSTEITSTINAVDTAISIADATGWPTGAHPFLAVIDRGEPTEEKVICSARAGTSITISTRGADNTSAASHTSGATFEHCFGATDLDMVNEHATDTTTDCHPQYLLKDDAESDYLTQDVAEAVYLTLAEAVTGYNPKRTLSSQTVTASATTTGGPGDLAGSSGPAVSVTVPPSGAVRVSISCHLGTSAANVYAQMGFALTGANTVAYSNSHQIFAASGSGTVASGVGSSFYITGLTPGVTTFTAKYMRGGGAGTADFAHRIITVETMP